MAYEAVVTDLLGNAGDPIQYKVSSAGTIPKGSLMEAEDLRTAKINSATNKPIAGIAAAEKNSTDSETSIAVYTNCIAKMTCSGAGITVGAEVVASAAGSQIKAAETLDRETGDVIGYAMESISNGETGLIRVQK